jgi:hypothetical protein
VKRDPDHNRVTAVAIAAIQLMPAIIGFIRITVAFRHKATAVARRTIAAARVAEDALRITLQSSSAFCARS